MKRERPNIPEIYTVKNYLTEDKILPIYFLFGVDSFAIYENSKIIQNTLRPLIESDFDIETFSYRKDLKLSTVLESASVFPFGSKKKLIVLKNFEKISDKKILHDYAENPPEFTVLIITNHGEINDFSRKPYSTLQKKGFVFQSRKLKRKDLILWLCRRAETIGLKLNEENAEVLIDISGDDRNLLEIQLQKLQNYLGQKNEVDLSSIEVLSSSMKESTIFNLLNAVGKGDKSTAIKTGYNLLSQNYDMVRILNMLTKYITVISQSMEISKSELNVYQAAKKAGVSKYFYSSCASAKFMKNEQRLLNSVRTLYQADLELKTTSVDERTLLAVVLDKMMN